MIAARYFSSNPSDSGSLRTPRPPASKPAGRRGITPAFGYGAPHPSAGGTLTLLTHALPSAQYGLLRPCAPLRYSHPYGDLPFGFLPSHRGTGSHVPCKSPAQLHAAFMPDVVRAAIRPSPGLVPGQRLLPGFDIIYTLSTRHQRFARARLSEPYLTGSSPAFSATLTTPAFDRRSLRWFEACP